MPCYHPKPAWQARPGGALTFAPPAQRSRHLYRFISVPCTSCTGCIKAHAQAWAFRCHLEGTRFPLNTFTTLTYDNEHVPYTLQIRHLQLFFKSLRQRAARTVRYFASGEYGTRTQRPHYHAILFGYDALGANGQRMVQDSWARGQVRSEALTAARIAYCAGYTDKKAIDRFLSVAHCDPETGEVWQPPFITMSRRPGLASHARQWKNSWRLFAVHQGNKIPVPRYLHQPWRDTATATELAELQAEKDEYLYKKDNSQARLNDAEQIALAHYKRSSEARSI